jgi:maleate isomerase
MNPFESTEFRDIGWRARIAIIYPEDGLLDADFYGPAPEGVSVHITRSYHQILDEKLDLKLAASMAESEDIEAAARTFLQIHPSCVAYACTSASFSQGKGFDQQIITRLEAVTNTKATTTATAGIAALKALGVQRISAVAPYGKEVSQQLASYLEEYGFRVLNLEFMDLPDLEIAKIDPGRIYRFVRDSDMQDAEAIFISCTNLRSFEVVMPLEKDLRKPVVSANQATIWHALRLSGIHEMRERFGTLFTY